MIVDVELGLRALKSFLLHEMFEICVGCCKTSVQSVLPLARAMKGPKYAFLAELEENSTIGPLSSPKQVVMQQIVCQHANVESDD